MQFTQVYLLNVHGLWKSEQGFSIYKLGLSNFLDTLFLTISFLSVHKNIKI